MNPLQALIGICSVNSEQDSGGRIVVYGDSSFIDMKVDISDVQSEKILLESLMDYLSWDVVPWYMNRFQLTNSFVDMRLMSSYSARKPIEEKSFNEELLKRKKDFIRYRIQSLVLKFLRFSKFREDTNSEELEQICLDMF